MLMSGLRWNSKLPIAALKRRTFNKLINPATGLGTLKGPDIDQLMMLSHLHMLHNVVMWRQKASMMIELIIIRTGYSKADAEGYYFDPLQSLFCMGFRNIRISDSLEDNVFATYLRLRLSHIRKCIAHRGSRARLIFSSWPCHPGELGHTRTYGFI